MFKLFVHATVNVTRTKTQLCGRFHEVSKDSGQPLVRQRVLWPHLRWRSDVRRSIRADGRQRRTQTERSFISGPGRARITRVSRRMPTQSRSRVAHRRVRLDGRLSVLLWVHNRLHFILSFSVRASWDPRRSHWDYDWSRQGSPKKFRSADTSRAVPCADRLRGLSARASRHRTDSTLCAVASLAARVWRRIGRWDAKKATQQD